MELHKAGYISQTVIYIRNKDYERAYSFAKEFAERFPDEMVAHYLLSASAFWAKKYEEAALEGRKAFNKASDYEDMLPCAIVTASSYYELKQYDKGFEFLQTVEKTKTNENLEKLMVLFSLARNDAKEAAAHLNELYKLNQEAAEELALRYLK